jgi:tRNA-uridine 2-sulfurtransferase
MTNKRGVIVGMSGGIDSSLSARLLREQGYEVEGASIILFDKCSRQTGNKTPCCSAGALMDAHTTAGALGVGHDFIDARDAFTEKVIRPFIDAYSKGLTPNPCILCNKYVKFPSLIRAADEKGFEFIATGHYAGVRHDEKSGPLLLRGLDTGKDQSYVLYSLSKEILGRLILPLGEKTKNDVRRIARELDMAAANRPESQEICFVEERNYVDFMDNIAAGEAAKGEIMDIETGKVIGEHGGIHLFTIGQRKRLPAVGRPIYVVRIDPLKKIVYTGPAELARMREFDVSDLNWLVEPSSADIRASVKARSMMKDEPATLHVMDDETVKVEYDGPQWAPAPGQAAVFYDGDIVLGGGVIRPYQ